MQQLLRGMGGRRTSAVSRASSYSCPGALQAPREQRGGRLVLQRARRVAAAAGEQRRRSVVPAGCRRHRLHLVVSPSRPRGVVRDVVARCGCRLLQQAPERLHHLHGHIIDWPLQGGNLYGVALVWQACQALSALIWQACQAIFVLTAEMEAAAAPTSWWTSACKADAGAGGGGSPGRGPCAPAAATRASRP